MNELLKLYEIKGIPQLIILDTKTGFTVTKTGRNDLQIAQKEEVGVHGVYNNWEKLHKLRLAKGIKAAGLEATAMSQRLLREELERRKMKVDRMKEDGTLPAGYDIEKLC